MYIRKNLRRMIAASLMVGGFTFTPITEVYNFPLISVAHAEVKTYTSIGEYLMSNGETMEIPKQGAKTHNLE